MTMERTFLEKSLRNQYIAHSRKMAARTTLPRLGDERGIIADLAPPAGSALSRRPRGRRSRKPIFRPGPRPVSRGLRTVLTMSVVFSWFGL
jgi:hypothetical protein